MPKTLQGAGTRNKTSLQYNVLPNYLCYSGPMVGGRKDTMVRRGTDQEREEWYFSSLLLWIKPLQYKGLKIMTTFILLTNMQIGQDSMGKLCPILFCNRWGTFNMGAGITFWKLTCSHTWCPGSPHIAGGWKAGAFLEFLSLCALSWPGSFSIVRLLTCWLRAPKVCVPRMSEPRFQGREIDSDGEAQPYTVRRVGASRAWSLSGSTTCHTTFFPLVNL